LCPWRVGLVSRGSFPTDGFVAEQGVNGSMRCAAPANAVIRRYRITGRAPDPSKQSPDDRFV